jgi:hypothetical protein
VLPTKEQAVIRNSSFHVTLHIPLINTVNTGVNYVYCF